MVDPTKIADLLRGLTPARQAVVLAYIIVPSLVVALAIPGGLPSLSPEADQQISVVELKSELGSDGRPRSRPGTALILEPIDGEFRLPLSGKPSQIWSSLANETVEANRDRLRVDGNGLRIRGALLGVSEPVAIIVEGAPGAELQVPGGTRRLDDFQVRTRHGLSLLAGVVMAWLIALGISVANAVPSVRRDENAASEVGA